MYVHTACIHMCVGKTVFMCGLKEEKGLEGESKRGRR